ncbi:MAG: hypothetical protein IT290_12830 [Deltaproteobacteria bacterium]|nr:hypothetical protein [Deltaproteobacteria bacterium]
MPVGRSGEAGTKPATSTGRSLAFQDRRLRFDGRVPIVIGVTGHRDMAPSALPQTAQLIRSVLLDYRRRYPETPILLVSALAEGADRLVAQIALDPELGGQVLVPLPMPINEYLDSFQSEASRDEFVSLCRLDGVVTFAIPDPAPTPDDAFMNLAKFLSRNCDVVIALWDGGESRGKGGTRDVVSFVLGQSNDEPVAPGSQLDPLIVSPVYHVITPRQDADAGEVQGRWLFPEMSEYHTDEEAMAYFHRLLEPLNAFNSESRVADTPPSPSDVLGDLFQRADRLAVAYRGRTFRIFTLLSLFVALAAFAVDAGEHVFVALRGEGAKYLGLLLYPSLMALAFLIYQRCKRLHLQDRFQDYRALAEGLRVQRFWQMAGIEYPVSKYYIGKQRTELFWIRRACQTARLMAGRSPRPLSRESLISVLEGWAREQLRYFKLRAKSEHRRYHRLHTASLALFWSGLAVAAFVGVVGSEPVHGRLSHIEWIGTLLDDHSLGHHIAILYVIMSAVLAALFHNYGEKTAAREHSRQYERMERLFEQGCTDIEKRIAVGQLAEAQGEIFRLGQEALAENGDWLITHRERPLEVPHH